MNIRNEIIEPNGYYHIYNRGINGATIFQNEENYHYFLRKFDLYLNSICQVYAYCLMPNHFHFLIKVANEETLANFAESNLKISHKKLDGLHCESSIFSKQMAKFLSCYTQSFNKVNNRHGSLLESPFKRLKIDSEIYLKNLILYINQNPTGSNTNYENYLFSSYAAILSEAQTKICREEVITIFGDLNNFIHCHKNPPKYDFKF